MRLFCLFLMFSLRQIPLHGQVNLELIGHLKYDSTTLAGCWHHVDQEGNEYGLIGTSRGLSIVNLNEPSQPYEAFSVPAPINNWREVKTWQGYAYVSTEAANSGITIVNLNHLPDSVSYKVWTGDAQNPDMVLSAHAVAATDGYLYIFGSKPVANGAIICNLNDPWNPVVTGIYNGNYVHDGYIRGDTLWTGEIYAGKFGVIDISNKSNPQKRVDQSTPGLFNHNTWLSDDSRTLYTTDERGGAPLSSFDVSDLDNIRLLDTYYPSEQPLREVHNVHVLNDYLINPSYGGQLTIVDGHKPDNLVEVGFASLGVSLVWDADPYLPSGIVFATAKNEGLSVYRPTYKRACYLEGSVVDSLTGLPLQNVTIRLIGTVVVDSTNALGLFKTGYHTPGFWTVEVSHPGYTPKTFTGINLIAGQVTQLNAQLVPLPTGTNEPETTTKVKVFPSSFTDYLNIDIKSAQTEKTLLEITDLNGRFMYSEMLSNGAQKIQVGAYWPRGHYLLTFKGSQGVFSMQKVLKI
jgi:choice-of-anchor B domain-containing protein